MDRITDVSNGNARVFTDGNDLAGIAGTIVPALWLDGVQEELVGLIVAAGLTPDPNDNTLVGKAIAILMIGRLLNRRVFSSSATYVPTPGTKSVFVQLVGGGASGAGTQNTGAGQVSAGIGGAGGGYAEKFITSGFVGAAITIGAGGATAGPNAAGNPGGTTSFGSIVSATGGGVSPVGPAAAANNQPQGAAQGGVGIGGDINGRGGAPIYAVYTQPATSSPGGRSYFGDGGLGTTGSGNGSPGVTPGSGGGGGAQSTANAAGAYGGAGAAGVVVVWEFT